jgi:hypothetical protein
MSPWRRPTRQFHGLPSDSFPYTLPCQPMAAGRDGGAVVSIRGHYPPSPSDAFTWSTSCPMSLRRSTRSARSAHANTSEAPSTCNERAGPPAVVARSWRSLAIHVWSGCSESMRRMLSVLGTRVASSTIRICCITTLPHSSKRGLPRGASVSSARRHSSHRAGASCVCQFSNGSIRLSVSTRSASASSAARSIQDRQSMQKPRLESSVVASSITAGSHGSRWSRSA